MTDKNLKRANEIKDQVSNLQEIRIAAHKPYLTFFGLQVQFGGLVINTENSYITCDKGLNEVIKEYCDKRIEELKAELEAL